MRWLGRILLWGLPIVLIIYLIGGTFVVYRLFDRLHVVGNVDDIAAAGQAPSSDPYELSYRGDPQAAFGLPFETVAVPTPLGDAEAWLIPPAAGAPAKTTWAVFVHGFAGHREGGYRYVPELHAAGFPILMISYRNDAEAPKSTEGIYAMGLTEWPDADAALTYALGRGATGILLIGDSMGGAIVGETLKNSGQADKLVGMILDSPALDYVAVTKALVERIGLPLAPALSALATRVFSWVHGVPMATAVSLEAVAAYPGPLLLIHGTGDDLVPIVITDRLVAQRIGATTRLKSEANHLMTRQEDSGLYDTTLRNFLAGLNAP